MLKPIARRQVLKMAGAAATGFAGAMLLSGRASAQALPLKVAAGPAIDHVTVFAAVDRGIYDRNGLDAKVKLYPTGVEEVNALQSGEAHVGIFGSTPLLVSVGKGIPLVLISYNHGDPNSMTYDANQGIVASAASHVRKGDIAALAGKKIALPVGTEAEPYLYSLLKSVGVSQSQVKIVNAKPADTPIALLQGSVDAVTIWEPWSSIILRKVPGSVRVSAGQSSWFGPGTTVSTRDVVAKNRDLIKRFLVAHAESHQWVRQHMDDAAGIAVRWITGLDLDIAKEAIRAAIYDIRMSRLTYEGYNKITIPYQVAQHNIDKSFDASKAIDPSILIQVMEQYPQFFGDLKPIPPENQLK